MLLPLKRSSSNNDPPQITLLCFNITFWPKQIQFLTLCLAVFELLFRLPGMKPFGWYLTLIQFYIYSGLSYAEMRLTTGTVIFKCCKLIPVLIGGIIIQGKRYGIYDVMAAILMSCGLVMFSLADSQVSPNFDMRGYAMISLALVADAIIGNVQEKAMKTYNGTNSEMVLYSYSIGSIYIFISVVLTGEIFHAILFFWQHPIETYGYTIIYSILGFLGVNIVLTLVRTVGALLTVTTMRKAVTIIFSFYFFSKPFTITYIYAGIIVLIAIYLNVYNKNQRAINNNLSKWWTKLFKTHDIDKKPIIGV